MKKPVALTLLLITTLGVINTHVDMPMVDGRRFVLAQGQLHDVQGWIEDRWNQALRHCGRVQDLPLQSDRGQASLRAIQAFSPPDSYSARMLQLQSVGPWLLAEVEFERLSPAVVPLLETPEGLQVLGQAIWSGSTAPWRPAPLIRRHLLTRAHAMPEALGACFTPRAALFQPT